MPAILEWCGIFEGVEIGKAMGTGDDLPFFWGRIVLDQSSLQKRVFFFSAISFRPVRSRRRGGR